MKQSDIDAGLVIVIVGFAPLKPAKFLIVRIQQKVGQIPQRVGREHVRLVPIAEVVRA